MAINALQSAASGLSALNTALDVTANNLANVNTPGFKGSRVNFQDLLYIEKAQPGTINSNEDQRPTGLYVGLGVKASGTQLDFTQGAQQQTGRQLDAMIEGAGFFQVAVEDSKGPNGKAYTRAGSLALNSKGELVLANDQGRRLQPVITIPTTAVQNSVSISPDGRVTFMEPGATDPTEAGQLELATFVNPAGLKQVGENLYVETGASGNPNLNVPGTNGSGVLMQGYVESSNVNVVEEMVNMIQTQRAYEINSKAITTSDQMLQRLTQM